MNSTSTIEYIPEDNLVVLFLLVIITGGMYLFWWLSRVSRVFGDSPVTNVLLVIFTGGLWFLYLSMKYMQRAEELNGRELKWFMILFLPLAFLIIQHDINEKYFPGR